MPFFYLSFWSDSTKNGTTSSAIADAFSASFYALNQKITMRLLSQVRHN